jgi:Zn-dependent peptidase ImmA (M78 family)
MPKVDEFTAVLRARELVKSAKVSSIPPRIEAYLEAVGNCKLQVDGGLPPDEPGYSARVSGKDLIVVNGNDRAERQRFTACHELGHIVLDLPSDHTASPLWCYAKRPANEIYCDVFAAELLLPYPPFKPVADASIIGFAALDDIARDFEASVTATGSRFAAAVDTPCAFVLSERGVVRYASRSKPLREAGAWIAPGMAVPVGSLSKAAQTKGEEGPIEVQADLWFSDWRRGGVLLEETRYLTRWDQTLTLLWFEDEEVPQDDDEVREDLGLRELDGVLPWPGKKRRR